MSHILFILFLFPIFLFSDPWGKDADLIKIKNCPQTSSKPYSSSFLSNFGKKAIQFHQDVISPADGPRSHFIPSSSQYTKIAMQKYGFFKGFIMGCDRLMRENEDPWVYQTVKDGSGKTMKWDPVK